MFRMLFVASLSFCVLYPPMQAQGIYLPRTETPHYSEVNTSRRVWYGSLAALAVANALDIHSSLGKIEKGRILASPDGRFGLRGVGIKIGIQIPFVAYQFWRHKRHSRSAEYAVFSSSNFALGGVYTGHAVRNYGIPRPVR